MIHHGNTDPNFELGIQERTLTFDVSVSFQGGHEDVEEPEEDEEAGGGDLVGSRPAQLPADGRHPTDHHDGDGHDGRRAKQRHGESQAGKGKKVNWSRFTPRLSPPAGRELAAQLHGGLPKEE